LIKGKYEEEVDFDIEIIDGNTNIDYNMAMIDSMCGK
jgi:hypothetical protein